MFSSGPHKSEIRSTSILSIDRFVVSWWFAKVFIVVIHIRQ